MNIQQTIKYISVLWECNYQENYISNIKKVYQPILLEYEKHFSKDFIGKKVMLRNKRIGTIKAFRCTPHQSPVIGFEVVLENECIGLIVELHRIEFI